MLESTTGVYWVKFSHFEKTIQNNVTENDMDKTVRRRGRKDMGAIITVYFFRKDIDNISVRVKPSAVLFFNSVCRYKLGFKISAEDSHRQD